MSLLLELGIEQLHLSPLRQQQTLPNISPEQVDLIQRFGTLLPVVARESGHRQFEILQNAETWLATQAAGHHQVSVLVHEDISDAEAFDIVNQKTKPNPIIEARLFERALTTQNNRTRHGAIAQLALESRRSRTYVSHALRLLKLPADIQTAIEEEQLTAGHGKALLGCKSPQKQRSLAAETVRKQWSVRQTERAVRAQHTPALAEKSADHKRLERKLSEMVGSQTDIDMSIGHLTIDFGGSLDVLDGVLARLGYHGD